VPFYLISSVINYFLKVQIKDINMEMQYYYAY